VYDSNVLLKKLKEIEDLIQDNINPDGSCRFDSNRVFMSLELAVRMFKTDELPYMKSSSDDLDKSPECK